MTILATLVFTPVKTGLCIGYANYNFAVSGGGYLRLRLNLVAGNATANGGGWAGIPERPVASSTQNGPECVGYAGTALFSVIGGVPHTLQLEQFGYSGVVLSSSVFDIYLRARAYKL